MVNNNNFAEESSVNEFRELVEEHEDTETSEKLFKKYKWPIIDVTRKSVEETAATAIRIYEIKKGQKK